MRAALLPVLLLLACGGRAKNYYVRVVEPGGRAYYTHTTNALYSETAGFVTFRDLVTHEEVRLANGKYCAEPIGAEDVEKAQNAYLGNPKEKPKGTFKRSEISDGSVWD